MATILSKFLNEAPSLQPLREQLQRLRELHQVYSDAVPGSLSKASRVGYLDGTTLIIIAFNGATAANLKQRLPGLLARIQRRQPEVTGLRVEVQVEEVTAFSLKKPPTRRLSAASAGQLTRLAEEMTPSALKQALTRLAGRSGSNQNQSLDDVKKRHGGEQDDEKAE